jgi:hypothetical protein
MGADATIAGLSDFYVKRFNLASRDAEYQKNRVTLGRIKRDGDRLKNSGDAFYVTVRVADAWSDSPNFADGMKYYSKGKTFRWTVGDPYPQYGRVTFEGLLLNKSSLATIIDVKKTETEGVANNMLDSLEFQLWNDGSGARARIAVGGLGGTAAVRVLTMETPSDVYNLPIGTVLFGSTSSTGSGGTDHGDIYKVTQNDPQNAQVTAERIAGSADDLAVGDYLYSVGSKGAHMPGIPSFIPSADPTDTLYGVARTGTGPATSGWRFSFVNSIHETIQRSFATMGRWVNRAAANFSVCLSTTDWFLLSQELEGKIVYDPTAQLRFGTEGLVVRTPFGPVTCIAIPQLKDGRGYILDWTTWTLYTLGNLPHIIDDDGKVMQRLGAEDPAGNNFNGDGVEMRYRIWKALLCDMPMSNATFPTA